MNTLVMTEEFWMNSMLSVARFSGGINVNGKLYILDSTTKDLIRKDFLKAYQKIGRNKVIEMLKEGKSKEEIEEYAKSLTKEKLKKIEPPILDLEL